MPVNVFFESLMLKVDEGLAEGISEPKRSAVPDIDQVVRKSMARAQEKRATSRACPPQREIV